MKVLFVCSGNTCRSPLAEALLETMAEVAGRGDIEISSAGTQAWDGSPASDGSMLVGMERGLDLSPHRSRQLTTEMLEEADLVLVMAPSHLVQAKEMHPSVNAHLLGGYVAGRGNASTLQDPFGGDLAAYRETADDIERELEGILEKIPVQ